MVKMCFCNEKKNKTKTVLHLYVISSSWYDATGICLWVQTQPIPFNI